jgi:ribosomal protein S18 acetylase RimI-like enzyme/predicted double-glycine peptidase
MNRAATLEDISALVDLEERCFDTDRISKRQFRHLLTRGNAAVLVTEHSGRIVGDVVVLFSRATSVARLYSLAVDPEMRGHGLARKLMHAAEKAAWKNHRAYMRLEVRKDNKPAIALYESMDYRRFGEVEDYYADHTAALRYEKALFPELHPALRKVIWYEQSLDFTCGPAALMMAMATLDPGVVPDRKLELRLWREATTIFMTSGHGGCGPYGLALAAARQGFRVEVYVSDEGVHLGESVRSEEKREVMRLVQEDMEEQLQASNVPITIGTITDTEMEAAFSAGAIPLVMISSWQIYGERFPHWVVVTGFDEHFVYVNDPYVDHEQGETALDSIHMPIARERFASMARYGRVKLQAVVFLSAPRTGKRRSAVSKRNS